MPFMQRKWRGIALHAGPLPVLAPRHGLYPPALIASQSACSNQTSVGTRVVIAPNKVEAISISHPLLERPAARRRLGGGATTLNEPEIQRDEDFSEEAEASAGRSKKGDGPRASRSEGSSPEANSTRRQRELKPRKSPAKVRAEAQVPKAAVRCFGQDSTLPKRRYPTGASSSSGADCGGQPGHENARSRAWPLSRSWSA